MSRQTGIASGEVRIGDSALFPPEGKIGSCSLLLSAGSPVTASILGRAALRREFADVKLEIEQLAEDLTALTDYLYCHAVIRGPSGEIFDASRFSLIHIDAGSWDWAEGMTDENLAAATQFLYAQKILHFPPESIRSLLKIYACALRHYWHAFNDPSIFDVKDAERLAVKALVRLLRHQKGIAAIFGPQGYMGIDPSKISSYFLGASNELEVSFDSNRFDFETFFPGEPGQRMLGKNVLVVGCGNDGLVFRALLEGANKAVGIDINGVKITLANLLAPALHQRSIQEGLMRRCPNIKVSDSWYLIYQCLIGKILGVGLINRQEYDFIRCDARDMFIAEDDSFDIVIVPYALAALTGINDGPAIMDVVKEIMRVVKLGGEICIYPFNTKQEAGRRYLSMSLEVFVPKMILADVMAQMESPGAYGKRLIALPPQGRWQVKAASPVDDTVRVMNLLRNGD
ncbi:MAG: class I SAM-dependent methyltransferase, partial [Candidatus Omnitrophica bacterium]|nr:class I SAM-dependent methyltransferase [Candidatus Omnitrophota bacterium]